MFHTRSGYLSSREGSIGDCFVIASIVLLLLLSFFHTGSLSYDNILVKFSPLSMAVL